MFKSVMKFVIVFMLTAVLAIGAASSAFFITRRIINSNKRVEATEMPPETELVNAATNEVSKPDNPKEPDYYMIRLEGETLGVYASFDGREDFLYTTDVYRTNLSSDDVRILTSGVRLKNYAELTSFMEDYTS